MNSRTNHSRRPQLRGFTLIEISIVFAISGLALVAAVQLLQQYRAHEIISVNNERLETVRKALSAYVEDNKKLPCPARRDLISRSPAYGRSVANCTVAAAGTVSVPSPVPGVGSRQVRIGAVPVRDLGLGDPYIADAWGNQFTYAVTEDLTVAATFDPTRSAINVVDPVTGNSVMTPPGPDAAMYLVSSPGRDSKGAWSIEGKRKSVCAITPGYDNENCNDDATFAIAPYSTSTAATHFDDQMGYTNAMEETMYPICPPGERLTSIDGVSFVCDPIQQPPVCAANERLTSTDGITFTCLAVSDPPVCAANQYVISPDGFSFLCTTIPAPPAPPPPLALPNCDNNGQALTTTNGTTLSCTTLPLKAVTAACNAVSLGSGWWGCTATCPAGTAVTGGSADGDNVQVDRGQYSGKSGNGWHCKFQLTATSCWSGSPPCGVRCLAECTDSSN